MTRTLTFFALAALLAGGCRKGEAPSAPDVAETPAAAAFFLARYTKQRE